MVGKRVGRRLALFSSFSNRAQRLLRPHHAYGDSVIQLELDLFCGKIRFMESVALAIDRMTIAEKLMAMEALWDNLCRDEAQIPVPEWHKEVLDERRRQIETGEAGFVDWETAKARIRDRIS